MSWVFGPGGTTATPGGADKDIQFNNNGEFSGSNLLITDGSGSLSASVNISASAFYGDGSNLTGLTASAVNVADGPEFSLQFRRDAPVTGEISGSGNFSVSSDMTKLSITGTLAVSGATAANIEGPVIITSPEGKLEVQDTTNNYQVTLVPAAIPRVAFGTIANETQYMVIDGGNTNRVITVNDFFIATSSTFNQGLYYDVSLERFGISTSTPTHDFTVNGNTAVSGTTTLSASAADGQDIFVGSGNTRTIGVLQGGGDDFFVIGQDAGKITLSSSSGIEFVTDTSEGVGSFGSPIKVFDDQDGTNTVVQLSKNGDISGSGNISGSSVYVDDVAANGVVVGFTSGRLISHGNFTFASDVLSVPTVTASVGVMVTSSTNGSINIGEGISYRFGGNGRLDVFENEFRLNKTNLYQSVFPEQTSNFDIGDSQVFPVDTNSSIVTGTLPGVNTSEDIGITYTIKDSGGNAGTNDVVVEPSGSQKIDGGTAAKITTNYGAITVVSISSSVNGFGWGIVSAT